MKLRFHPAAEEELSVAISYLNERTPGLGVGLLDDIERTTAFLCEVPNIGKPIDSVHRLMPLQRFTYDLAYRVGDGEIVVVAIAHKRRRPGYWLARK
jgi:toxin ParE1/3/4